MTAAEWLEAVREAERRGELLLTVDLADRGLTEHPDAQPLEYRAVLALARAGATEEAARRFGCGALSMAADDDDDVAALEARITKDRALAAPSAQARRSGALLAADRYAAVAARSGSWYPLINAATLRLLAGDLPAARALAGKVLGLLSDESLTDDYYAAATHAEALLHLGDTAAAADALARAAALAGGDRSALATTYKQLALVCEALGVDPEVLAVLRGPAVAHYCGHLVSSGGGRFASGDEEAVAEQIATVLDGDPIGFAYGALAAGGDVLWAEALLERGAELNVVLPFSPDDFVAASVAPAGDGWVRRFQRCLASAAAVEYATSEPVTPDDALLRYGSELAMGLTLLRARHLAADARQLAVWDGQETSAGAGTAIDVDAWRDRGGTTVVVKPPSSAAPAFESAPPASGGRIVRSLLFADVKGFSRLPDEALPRFYDSAMRAFADVLDRHADQVEARNSWGDALYVVVRDVEGAAEVALELQEAMLDLDFTAAGLPPLALRLSAHVGPVFPILDPVIGRSSVIGAHVTRAARIEPVTPPGDVYVTEPFAAALELADTPGLACDYVGHLPSAKDWGRMRMYRLRRTAGG